MVSLIIGKRDHDTLAEVVADFAERTGNVPPRLTTTDDCATYSDILLEQYGQTIVPSKTGKRGRPRKPYRQWPAGAAYATVNKTFREGRVTAVARTLVHGTEDDLARGLTASS
ncbi:MAG: hypothetical protein HYV63_25030, partial [Candidatus Schekmanbacteria bacterium]|nr:hypothetical protein [Candidatus Schekmanbacteria bacterium]